MSNIIEKLNWRYATKKFDTKKLSDEKLDILLESLRLSASSFGLQTWKFILVENTEIREKLVPASWGQQQVKDASHLLVFARPEKIDEKDVDVFITSIAEQRGVTTDSLAEYKAFISGFMSKMDEDQKAVWMSRQIYLALGNLLTVAAIEDVDTCPMEGFEPDKYDEILGLSEKGLKSVVVCPIGYRHADDKYSEIKKVRFSKEDIFITI